MSIHTERWASEVEIKRLWKRLQREFTGENIEALERAIDRSGLPFSQSRKYLPRISYTHESWNIPAYNSFDEFEQEKAVITKSREEEVPIRSLLRELKGFKARNNSHVDFEGYRAKMWNEDTVSLGWYVIDVTDERATPELMRWIEEQVNL